jgi:hypothetical protein
MVRTCVACCQRQRLPQALQRRKVRPQDATWRSWAGQQAEQLLHLQGMKTMPTGATRAMRPLSW